MAKPQSLQSTVTYDPSESIIKQYTWLLGITIVKNCLLVFEWLCLCTNKNTDHVITYSEPGEKQLVQRIQFQTLPFCKKKSSISSLIKP